MSDSSGHLLNKNRFFFNEICSDRPPLHARSAVRRGGRPTDPLVRRPHRATRLGGPDRPTHLRPPHRRLAGSELPTDRPSHEPFCYGKLTFNFASPMKLFVILRFRCVISSVVSSLGQRVTCVGRKSRQAGGAPRSHADFRPRAAGVCAERSTTRRQAPVGSRAGGAGAWTTACLSTSTLMR